VVLLIVDAARVAVLEFNGDAPSNAAEAAPVIGHPDAAVRNGELQLREILNTSKAKDGAQKPLRSTR